MNTEIVAEQPTVPAPLRIQQFDWECDVCHAGFDWSDDSGWYGVWEPLDIRAVFCCETCKENYDAKLTLPSPCNDK